MGRSGVCSFGGAGAQMQMSNIRHFHRHHHPHHSRHRQLSLQKFTIHKKSRGEKITYIIYAELDFMINVKCQFSISQICQLFVHKN